MLGKKIVLAVAGSIAAVRTVEVARELIRHGADVIPVMSGAATKIIHPEALHFGTGNKPIVKITGAVEHVGLLGDVPNKADLLLIAPITANTLAKLVLGIDDSTVTTCATVALGTKTPIVIAPAMHEAMLEHEVMLKHQQRAIELGCGWVEPRREEFKAKLADPEAIAEAVIHHLNRETGPLAGKRCLVVGGATAEPVDDIRVLTNRSSGQSACHLATELYRQGADVEMWYGNHTSPAPSWLPVTSFATHGDLQKLAEKAHGYDLIWMPAAIADYTPVKSNGKIPSGQSDLVIPLQPVGKIIPLLQESCPDATMVAFKAESDESKLLAAAKQRLQEYGVKFIIANAATAFANDQTKAIVIHSGDEKSFAGPKREVMTQIVDYVVSNNES